MLWYNSVLNVRAVVAAFNQPSPSRGLLHDYEPLDGPFWSTSVHFTSAATSAQSLVQAMISWSIVGLMTPITPAGDTDKLFTSEYTPGRKCAVLSTEEFYIGRDLREFQSNIS